VQHVIHTVVAPRFLNGSDVRRLFDNADQALVAGGTAAIHAGIDVRDVVAYRAEMKAGLNLPDGFSKQLGIFVTSAQDVKGEALRRLAADARQLLEFLDEPRHRLCKFRQLIL